RDIKSGQERAVDFSRAGLLRGGLEAMLSPDGRKVAFQFKPESADQPRWGIYTADLDPEGRVGTPRFIAEGCFTAWRGDSAALLISRFTDRRGVPGTEIWLADLGGPREQLTRSLDWDYFPAWSPDQRWLVWAASPLYSHDQQTGQYEIFVKRLHDKNAVRLTFHTAPDVEPTWRAGRSKLKGAVPDFVYEAEDYAKGAAGVADMPGASGGKVALVERHAPRAGAVVYGQYDVLAPGSYVVRFRMRFGKPVTEGLVAELDVAVDSGGRILAKRALHAGDVAPERFEQWELAFSSEQLLTGLECRVSFYPGVADLMVDVITVKPAGAASWLQPLKDLWARWWGS
ncbi:MAG: hypothetical protein C0405_14355, partial [Desulfovibrio sp.]|nr:hypothetical protein [Desulfovibrio sp.]